MLSGLVDPVAISRFERECATIGSLSGHPHVVSVYDAGTTLEGSPYLAMEYLPRGSLADRVQARGPLPTAEILRIGVQLCDALEAAHQAGVLHRDIKPENVLVDTTGECKLADFGVAAVVEGVDSRDTAPGALLGTVLHLAPEVLEGGRAAVTSDVYSLGSTLASLALGRAPFARTGDETVIPLMMRIVRDPLPDLRAAGARRPRGGRHRDGDGQGARGALRIGRGLRQRAPADPAAASTCPSPRCGPSGRRSRRSAPAARPAPRRGGADPATAIAPVVACGHGSTSPPAEPPPRHGAAVAGRRRARASALAAVVGFLVARQDDDDPHAAPRPLDVDDDHRAADHRAAARRAGGDAPRGDPGRRGLAAGLGLQVVDTERLPGPRASG